MIKTKKSFLWTLTFFLLGQLLAAQSFQMITLSADGEKTTYALSDVQKIVFENNTMIVNLKSGDSIPNITRLSFDQELSKIDYSALRINEVSGVGSSDCDKFYELINTGADDINMEGCQIFYNANSNTGGTLPSGDGNLTWTGDATQVAKAGKLFSLIGRNGGNCSNPTTSNSFTTGLTAARILIITLKDPAGNVIDQCIRAQDTGDYAITDKSFSRIPDGTGPFYFTTPTPDSMNGTDATGLVLVPQPEDTGIQSLKVESSIFIFPNPVKESFIVNGVKKDAKISLYDLNGKLLQTITAEGNSTKINVSSLQQGTYLLNVGGQTLKFVKQ